MKIAFISHEFPPDTGKGGIGTYVSQISEAMAEAGNEVHVFAGSYQTLISYPLNKILVHKIKCENAHDFRKKVLPVFAAQNLLTPFDLIESPEINGNAWEIKKSFQNIPLVVRLHAPNHLVESLKKTYIPFLAKLRFVLGSIRRFKFDLGNWKSYKKEGDIDYQFIKLADFITSPSIAMKEWVVKNWQIEPDKITVIPNIFLPSLDLLNIPVFAKVTYKRIVFFGRLNVLKGLVNATKAMAKILQQFPDWKFRVIGDNGPGPFNDSSMREWMQKEFKNVHTQVEFLDGMPYEELPTAISDAEIVLLPSLFESFSYTCAEAMAAGKVVVGSNNAGMADLIENNKSGILINPYISQEITGAIHRLITDNEFRYSLSINARKSILKNQNASQTIDLFQQYYHNILKEEVVKN